MKNALVASGNLIKQKTFHEVSLIYEVNGQDGFYEYFFQDFLYHNEV